MADPIATTEPPEIRPDRPPVPVHATDVLTPAPVSASAQLAPVTPDSHDRPLHAVLSALTREILAAQRPDRNSEVPILSQELFDRVGGLLDMRIPPGLPKPVAVQMYEYARALHHLGRDIATLSGLTPEAPLTDIPSYYDLERRFLELRATIAVPGGSGGDTGSAALFLPPVILLGAGPETLFDWMVKFIGAIPGLGEAKAIAEIMVQQGFLALFRQLRAAILKGQIRKAADIIVKIIKKMLSKKFKDALIKKLGKKAAFKIIAALTGLATNAIGWIIVGIAIAWALAANFF